MISSIKKAPRRRGDAASLVDFTLASTIGPVLQKGLKLIGLSGWLPARLPPAVQQ